MLPEKKSDIVRRLVADGEFRKALGIVKGFRLGIVKADSDKMTIAYECMIRPGFYEQLGTKPETAIAEGIRTLKAYYGQREDVT